MRWSAGSWWVLSEFLKHISTENFLLKLKKWQSTWGTSMGSYLPCRGRGIRRLDASRASEIHSDFANMFQIRNSFRNSKTRKYVKTIWNLLSPAEGVGMVWLDPDLQWSIRVLRTFFVRNVFWNSKTRKYVRYHYGGLFTPRRGWDETIGCLLIISDSFEFCEHISAQKFLQILKNLGNTRKTIRGSFPHRSCVDEVIGCIPISNCLVEFQEQVCQISGR